jgi:hypothetical protein
MMVLDKLLTLLREIRNRRTFAVERALLAGRHPSGSELSSIIHFTFNRAGSQYVKSILRRCAMETGLVPVDMNGYAYASSFPYFYYLPADEMRRYSHVFRARGYLYSAFNGFISGIPVIEQFRVLLVIRDPRDILTSNYFSDAFSHSRPPTTGDKHLGFDEARAAVQAMNVDQYVLAFAADLRQRYEEYLSNLQDRSYVCVIKYEDIVTDFPESLNRILTFCKLTISSELRDSLVEEASTATPASENAYRHLRRRVPGDHAVKLTTETISRLNAEFRQILDVFDYPISTSSIKDDLLP